MVFLHFIVEGPTEKEFIRNVLSPVLESKEIFVGDIRFGGPDKQAKGGVDRYQPVRDNTIRLVKEFHGDNFRFTSMFDYYGFCHDFPGWEQVAKINDPYERVSCFEKVFEVDVNDGRFISHFQLHEFETLLLVDPQVLANSFSQSASNRRAVAGLQAEIDQAGAPELVNDGIHTAPSKRIESYFAGYERQKRLLAPRAAQTIGLKKLREHCPHFDTWIARLESL